MGALTLVQDFPVKCQIQWTDNCLTCFWCSRCGRYSPRRNVRWAGIRCLCLCCSMQLVCTTCLNVLDSSDISSLLCLCCLFHNMVCARTRLIVARNTQALWSGLYACMMEWMFKDFVWALCLSVCRPTATFFTLVFCAPPDSTRTSWQHLVSVLHFLDCLC